MKRHLLIATMVLFALAGCSSSETQTPPAGSSGTSGTSGENGSSGTSGSPDTSSGGENTGIEAPKLDQIVKMSGALHVMWTNPADGCDSIEGERKATMADGTVHEEYKVVFTEPGEADNKHDMTATADMEYTYRLRCKKGDKYSPYSNEMAKNPLK